MQDIDNWQWKIFVNHNMWDEISVNDEILKKVFVEM